MAGNLFSQKPQLYQLVYSCFGYYFRMHGFIHLLCSTYTVGQQKKRKNVTNKMYLKKIPHTGDTNSLDRCG